MTSLAGASSTISTTNVPRLLPGIPKWLKFTNVIPVVTSRPVRVKQPPICCTILTSWESSPVKKAPAEDAGYDFLKKTTNIFKTLGSENTAEVLDL
ncbi:hypothetical protein Dsin_026373 [Dipteronia sinensis]|uniref:Uncharacterized protein n=1 Tax=Dipteronia sinensis TaxID=43782 RepID=A0AAE0DXY9_9ROSI|nr:hypothetical protein Dsin_026373 [Dipteronia sinensis]